MISTDLGKTWEKKNSGTNLYLNCIKHTSADSAYVVGHQGLMLRTTDGGNSWKNEIANTSERLISINFPEENVGYAVGTSGVILKIIIEKDIVSSEGKMIDDLTDDFSVVCFNDIFEINFQNRNVGAYSVYLYDVMGKLIHNEVFFENNIGLCKRRINAGAPKTGIYVIKVVGSDLNANKKVYIK